MVSNLIIAVFTYVSNVKAVQGSTGILLNQLKQCIHVKEINLKYSCLQFNIRLSVIVFTNIVCYVQGTGSHGLY